jgi:type I restriction enzyme R subunit
LRQTEAALRAAQAAGEVTPSLQLDLLTQLANKQAEKVELDEATTRILIDDQLRAAGWIVDSVNLRYSAGTRPQAAQAIAISEWPTASGPVDYALFIEGCCVAVIEAKRGVKDVPGRLGQAKRYARDIKLTADETSAGSPWIQGLDQFRVPFLFVTNGRPYVKQLATKSGIWFWDARPGGGEPRALSEWFSQDRKQCD